MLFSHVGYGNQNDNTSNPFIHILCGRVIVFFSMIASKREERNRDIIGRVVGNTKA
ncbi:Uncharacterized protein APZ42_021350 [Daphnia magna]|uniref:Uncharacterized protein n=1 Tax=Daphnia magna TaxID=35525 RepID=A0A164WRH2_9CRUS|nr:Uncharacterized protein APZ42_021350 [Daphnia magna]